VRSPGQRGRARLGSLSPGTRLRAATAFSTTHSLASKHVAVTRRVAALRAVYRADLLTDVRQAWLSTVFADGRHLRVEAEWSHLATRRSRVPGSRRGRSRTEEDHQRKWPWFRCRCTIFVPEWCILAPEAHRRFRSDRDSPDDLRTDNTTAMRLD
jgi:hypothetical protein